MRAIARGRRWVLCAVTLVGVMGPLVEMPEPVAGQPNPPQQSAQSAELEEAKRLDQQAFQLYNEGKYNAAIPLVERALAICEKVLGPEHPDVSDSLNNLASLYRAQGNYPKAEPLYQRALVIVEKVLGPEHPDVATSLNNLAALYWDRGNYPKAEPLFQRALTIREKVLRPEHPLVANSLNSLAALYWDRGDIARAAAFQTRANNIQEHNLALILTTGSEPQKRAYITTLSGETDASVSLHVEAAPNNPQAQRLALTTVLRRKGRVLDAVADNMRSLRRLKDDPQAQQLLDRLLEVRTQLAALAFKEVSNKQLAQYQTNFKRLQTQAEQLEAELNNRSAEFRSQTQPVELESIQKLIPADAALVELVYYKPFNPKAKKERWGEPRYAAYVLHRTGEPRWVDLGTATPINEKAQKFREAIAKKQEVKQLARLLDQQVMAPIRPLLDNSRHLLLSPDSVLNLIPFEALQDEQNRYLIESFSFTYLTTGRDLLQLTQNQLSRQEAVVFANPDYDDDGSKTVVRVNLDTSDRQNQRSIDLNLDFGPLLNTEKEALQLKDILPKNTKILLSSHARETALKQVTAPSLLHLATHGFFLPDQPQPLLGSFDTERVQQQALRLENPLLRSGLALAGANQRHNGQDDGVVTALEVAGLDLWGTQLVVLSACETGLGKESNSEGVYGLRRALVMAGSQSQVLSLWAVDGWATKDLMVNYYQHLLKGEGRHEALRQTKLAMLHDAESERQHPYYWASFIASGDWTPLTLK